MNDIPLDDLPIDSARRDRWGRYLVRPLPPNDSKPVGYTRVTTVAKALDSAGGLAPWKAAMTASGIIMRRGLRAQWEALLAQYGDPWYAGDEAKTQVKRLVEECAAVGGANDRKEVGSALHAITALIDAGETPQHMTEETERDVRAYTEGLRSHGVTLVPGAIEVCVVLDQFQVAGTFDRLAVVPGFDLPLIADLKTGANLSYSWQSIAVQLAAYSRGDAVYVQGKSKDGSDDQRLPMPAVDQHWGLIFWLNAGDNSDLEMYLVNLDQGWDAFQHSMWARGWAKAKPAEVFRPDDLTGRLQASVDKHPANVAPVDDDSHLSHDEAVQSFVLAWLQLRIDTIGTENVEARSALAARWPRDIPPPRRASDGYTEEQIAAVEQLLDGIERAWSISFPPPKPSNVININSKGSSHNA